MDFTPNKNQLIDLICNTTLETMGTRFFDTVNWEKSRSLISF